MFHAASESIVFIEIKQLNQQESRSGHDILIFSAGQWLKFRKTIEHIVYAYIMGESSIFPKS